MDFDKIDLKWKNMLVGIQAQVPFVRESPAAIYADICAKLRMTAPPEKIYLVGCGDSWYCGMATRLAFEDWARIPTEAVESLEFSRYLVHYAPRNSLVIAVSNSGRVSRTIEALAQAKKRGLATLAATSNLKEGISQIADASIDLAYSERRFAPGTSSYMASMIVEYCLALYLAEIGGRLTREQVDGKLAEISALAGQMQATIDTLMPILEKLAAETRLTDTVVYTGGGPNFGTAMFSMAKIVETTRTNAVGQELEEWAHIHYFTSHARTLTFVLAPAGASLDRACEQMFAVRAMESRCVAVCDPGELPEDEDCAPDLVLPIHGPLDEILSPILYCLPGELFAFYLGVQNNLTMLGFDNPRIKEVNFRQIFGSKIRE